MKTNRFFLYTMFLLATAAPVSAQNESSDLASEGTLSQEYDLNAGSEAGSEWWIKVERTINLPAGLTVNDVKAEQLQELVFFANVHSEKIDFRASVPQLLDIYRNHSDKAYRMLAVSALNGIGNRYGMEGLRDAVKYEPDPLVRRVTRAALASYDRHN